MSASQNVLTNLYFVMKFEFSKKTKKQKQTQKKITKTEKRIIFHKNDERLAKISNL